MKPRIAIACLLIAIVGCDAVFVQPASTKTSATVSTVSAGPLCAATASRLEAGHWDYTQRLYNSVKAVAKDDGITLPPDFESAMQPFIKTDLLIDDAMRSKLVALFQGWSK